MTVYGTEKFMAFHADSCGDHRIAMSMLIAGLVAAGSCTVDDTECISTSFPNFFTLLEQVSR
jgi:3-phosphoshikimate 1-carboxyvinyltransferase